MRRFLVFGLLVTIALVFSCASVKLSEITANMPDMSGKTDNVYRGGYIIPGMPAMKMTVDVTVKNQKIVSVNVIEHSGSPIGKKAVKTIIERVIEKQSLNIDAVSGATTSSKAILKAVENALL